MSFWGNSRLDESGGASVVQDYPSIKKACKLFASLITRYSLRISRYFTPSTSTNSGVLSKIKSAPLRSSSGRSPKPHSTPTVCAPAVFPARISTDVSPTIRQFSAFTLIFCAAQ